MKKFIFKILILVSCILGGCQEFEPYSKQDMFQESFEKYIGGPVHPDQNWGFYDVRTVSRTTRALSESDIQKQYDETNPFIFYDTSAFYKYHEDIQDILNDPATIKIDTEYSGSDDYIYVNGSILVLDGTKKPITVSTNLWTGKREIYVLGDVTFENKGTQQAVFYILPDAVLTIGRSYINDLELYVSPGGTLNYDFDKIDGNQNGKIFNAGTFIYDRDEFDVSNRNGIFYNEGYAEVNHLIANGNPSFIYNYGELKVNGELYLDNGGCLYNGGEMHVDGDTHFTNDAVWWVNASHYCTTNMNFSAGNGDAYNFCQLLVREQFNFHDGIFNLMHNSYVEAETAIFSNFTVHMYGHSGINIKSGTKFLSNGDGHNQGFHGDAETWSYFRLGGTTETANNSNCFVIMGKVAYAIENLVDHSINEQGNEACYFEDTTIDIPFEDMNAQTGEDDRDCYVEWTPEDLENPEKPKYETVRVIVEDLPATITTPHPKDWSDFDYNDAAFDVTFKEESTDITVHCCGGTLPLFVEGIEVHSLFGKNTNEVFINKNNGKTDAVMPPVTFTVSKACTNADDILVWVEFDNEKYYIESFTGKAPAKICVGTDYIWCDESVDIKTEYPGFADWAASDPIDWETDEWYR